MQKFWDSCMGVFRKQLPEPEIKQWFEPIIPISYTRETKELVLKVPSQHYFDYLEQTYFDLIHSTIKTIFGEGTQLFYDIVIAKDLNQSVQQKAGNIGHLQKKVNESNMTSKNPFHRVIVEDIDPQLNWKYTFDEFQEGRSNQMGRAVGCEIANHPGTTAFNPLFIYGHSGVGKTHLVHAIGCAAKLKNPDLRVLYVTTNLFQHQYTNAVTKGNINDFINFYQTIDLLIMDDVHELIGKTGTQNTFFNIFNHLHQNRKQIILTCDRQPSQMKDIEERMLTRFKWGLVTELERPDYELRKAILNYKIRKDGLSISSEVVDYIATNVTDNIRDLEGSIVSLLAQSTFCNKKIDMKLAEKVVKNLIVIDSVQLTIEKITAIVCKHLGVNEDVLMSKTRQREIVLARQMSMYFSKKYTNQSQSTIGHVVAGRDHATVNHSIKTVSNLLATDRQFEYTLKEIEQKILHAK